MKKQKNNREPERSEDDVRANDLTALAKFLNIHSDPVIENPDSDSGATFKEIVIYTDTITTSLREEVEGLTKEKDELKREVISCHDILNSSNANEYLFSLLNDEKKKSAKLQEENAALQDRVKFANAVVEAKIEQIIDLQSEVAELRSRIPNQSCENH